jgi:hypothetical protein
MPRRAELLAPGGTVNREFYFNTPADAAILLAHLEEMCRTYHVVLYADTRR